jgi:hypothetical protein
VSRYGVVSILGSIWSAILTVGSFSVGRG